MFEIISKKFLNETVVMMDIKAPLVANKAKAGQFIILRPNQDSERIPLTVAGVNKEEGTVNIIFQVVGSTTEILKHKNVGEFIADFVGPLGNPTEIEGLKKTIVVGGGVGTAIALPVARALENQGTDVIGILGFRNKDLVILEDEFKKVSKEFYLTTDDGSYGEKGNVCLPLDKILSTNKDIDKIFAIGPLIMMKFVVETAKKYNIPCIVSMNPIMIDGTGMCGCCRLTVDGKTKFACVDGPDFDGYKVDFDESMIRGNMYKEYERHAYEKTCNLFAKEKK
jgi:ferredoxin--NADP+ reductase